MTFSTTLLIVTVIAAISAALLAWFVVEAGTTGLARYRAQFTKQAKFQVQEFFLFIDPRSLFAANMALMALGGLGVWLVTGSFLMLIPTVLVLAMIPRMLYAWLRKKRLRKFEEQLPDALLMLSGGLRAGVGLSSAIQQLVAEATAPLSQEFGLLLREQRLGVTLEQSLNNLNRRVPTQTTTLMVSAMRIAAETGGGLAETLERTSHTIRSRLQMEGKIDALTAQGKLQAWVVGALPIVLMLILNKMEPDAMWYMWHSRAGWATLLVIGAFEFMGVYVIRKIIAIDV
jgi:tight adherence protein B